MGDHEHRTAPDPGAAGPVSVLERGLAALARVPREQVGEHVLFPRRPLDLGGCVWHGPVVGGDDPASIPGRAAPGSESAAASPSAPPSGAGSDANAARRRRAEREAVQRARMRADAEAAWRAMTEPVGSSSSWVAGLGVLPSGRVEVLDLLDVLAETDRAVAVAEARRLAVVVALVGGESSESSSAERQKAAEVARATGMSILSAETLIHRARMLAGPFDCFGAALAAGEVSYGHCLALLSQTADVHDPDVLAAIATAALPHARLVVSDFRARVDAVIAALDPDAVRRRQSAKDGRRVYTRRGRDGMSFLGLSHETAVVDRIYAQLVDDGAALLGARLADAAAADADAPGLRPSEDVTGARAVQDVDPGPGAAARGARLADGDLSPDACRADALAARVLGHRDEDGTVTWDPSANQVVTVEVVIDLDTLNGLADDVALLDGEPVPAAVGRDWARIASFFRRVVVDPVDGHLLDYGDTQYLPEALRRFCFARDGGCREPGCTRRALRFLQLDHAEEFPHGPSSAANGGALCRACHQRKTQGLFDITDSRADGSATFTSAWGQSVRIPPRRYLPRAEAPPATPPPEPPHDPPPF